MSQIRACRGCGELVSLAFETPEVRFERMFFEEAEKIGFFKMFSIEKGMIKIAALEPPFVPYEEKARSQNIPAMEDWQAKQKNDVKKKANDFLQMMMNTFERIKDQMTPDKLKRKIEELLTTNPTAKQFVPNERIGLWTNRIMNGIGVQPQNAPIPTVQTIPAKV